MREVVRIERTIDFAAEGITGSSRYKPRDAASEAERTRKDREAAARYRDRNRDKERARWRAVAARRRAAKQVPPRTKE